VTLRQQRHNKDSRYDKPLVKESGKKEPINFLCLFICLERNKKERREKKGPFSQTGYPCFKASYLFDSLLLLSVKNNGALVCTSADPLH